MELTNTTNELFSKANWFNGYWKLSGTTASKTLTKSYLTTEFFEFPVSAYGYVIHPNEINGYPILGIRVYGCKSLNGTAPVDIVKFGVYGDISGAIEKTVDIDALRKKYKDCRYFSVSVWVKNQSNTSYLTLSGKKIGDIVTVYSEKTSQTVVSSDTQGTVKDEAKEETVQVSEKPIVNAVAASADTQNSVIIPTNKITSIKFNYAPTKCISTSDSTATIYDDYQFSFFNVLKISDSMYYLYYTCFGEDDKENASKSSYKHLALAYSTDGNKWTRGIPKGITAPISGTNLLFKQSVFEHHVFKVLDHEYPYRLICNYGVGTRDRIRLYKSKDAVNFTFVRDIIMGNFDSQMTAIDKGGMIKVYLRLRTKLGTSVRVNRQIGYFFIDYDGNLISQPTIAFDAESLYNASAMPLDDHRDILFPTYYNTKTDGQELVCYILDNDIVTKVDIDTSRIISSDYQTFYVSPRGIVDIKGDLYIFYMVRDTLHNSSGGASHIMKAKVEYDTIGLALA